MNNYTVSIKSLVLLIALAAILVLLTAITVSATVYSPWTREAVETGTSGDRDCGKVGDADNDGDNEIISGNAGYIDMHEWSGTAWSRTIIDDTLGTVVVYDVVIADVDNTGRNKIAAALSNNTIFMYNWTGSGWECSVVSNRVDDGVAAGADKDVLDLTVGDADNTGYNKIVAGTEGGEVAMFNWTAGSWSRTEICDRTPKHVPNVDVADCDNDGSIEVFVCEEKGGYVYHYNGGWALESTVDTISEVAMNTDVGDADNTGGNKIIVSTNQNDIYMYNWTGGAWTKTTVTSGSVADIFDIKIGDVYNDGTNRIVAGDENDDVIIYTWNTGTSSWDSFTVDDAAGGAVLEVTSGDANNDGLVEIVIGTGGTGDDLYMYDSSFTISDVNAGGPYEAGETISVIWSLTGSASATEDYINVEYWDVTAGTQFDLKSHATSATSSMSEALTSSEVGHTIAVYVYTTSSSGGDRSTAITQGDPWPYSTSEIQGPIITSCNSAGDEINRFAPGENVSVSGTGLDANTNYTIWIQLDQVNESDAIVSTEDPSTTSPKNETVKTDTEGNFSATLIWSIPSGAAVTNTAYDIVVDNLESGTVGTYNATDDGLDSATVAGISAPVPELSTIILFSVGLLTLAGYVWLRRRN